MGIKKFKQFGIVLIAIVLVFSAFGTVGVSAVDVFGLDDSLNNMEGNNQWASEKYRDNYSLDVEGLGFFDGADKVLNYLLNIAFSILCFLGKITISIIYHALEFDMAGLLAGVIGEFITALNDTIFKPLFTIGFCLVAWQMVKHFFRKDIVGSFMELGKVIFLVVLSFMITTNAAGTLTTTFDITKSVNSGIVLSLSDAEDTTSYAQATAGAVWYNLIHLPWVNMEFGTDNPDEENIKNILETTPSSDNRESEVSSYIDKTKSTAFDKGQQIFKLVFVLFYSVITLGKSIIFIGLSALQIGMQAVAIFYLVQAPIVLLLCMMPGTGMMHLQKWLMKILETQITCVLFTIVLTLLLYVDSWLFTQMSGVVGLLITGIFQIIIYGAVILKIKDQVKGGFKEGFLKDGIKGGIKGGIQGGMDGLAGDFVNTAQGKAHEYAQQMMRGGMGYRMPHGGGYGYGGYGPYPYGMEPMSYAELQKAAEDKHARDNRFSKRNRMEEMDKKTEDTAQEETEDTTHGAAGARSKVAGKFRELKHNWSKKGTDSEDTEPTLSGNKEVPKSKYNSQDMPEDVRRYYYEKEAEELAKEEGKARASGTTRSKPTMDNEEADNKNQYSKEAMNEKLEKYRQYKKEKNEKTDRDAKEYWENVQRQKREGTYVPPWKRSSEGSSVTVSNSNYGDGTINSSVTGNIYDSGKAETNNQSAAGGAKTNRAKYEHYKDKNNDFYNANYGKGTINSTLKDEFKSGNVTAGGKKTIRNVNYGDGKINSTVNGDIVDGEIKFEGKKTTSSPYDKSRKTIIINGKEYTREEMENSDL